MLIYANYMENDASIAIFFRLKNAITSVTRTKNNGGIIARESSKSAKNWGWVPRYKQMMQSPSSVPYQTICPVVMFRAKVVNLRYYNKSMKMTSAVQ